MVGGNATAAVMRTATTTDARGVPTSGKPEKVKDIRGWLDYQTGQSSHLAYQAKIEDTTHIWLCDYDAQLASLPEAGTTLMVDDRTYEVLLIDDPMGLHEHLEVYLRAVG